MKNTAKLIRRFLLILLLSTVCLLLLNLILLLLYTVPQKAGGGAWTAAEAVTQSLICSENGTYTLSPAGQKALKEKKAWAILIEDKSGKVIWHSKNLPKNIPKHYTASQLARAVRGYLCDYPTAGSGKGDNLVLLGFPKDSYWKHMSPLFDYDAIASFPQNAALLLLFNLACILFIYLLVSSRFIRSFRPIIAGIQALTDKTAIHVQERGLLAELAASINKAAEKLHSQELDLRKKEMARSNWIAGVSHDIRTPLSMVMGYAGQLENDTSLNSGQRQKSAIIRKQSEKIKNLINDLNLASKLEYNMQPLSVAPCNMVAVTRQAAVDFMNTDLEGRHPLIWKTADSLSSCFVLGDKNLLKRAVANIIQNSINHNPAGCTISVTVVQQEKECTILISDNGAGASAKQIRLLNEAPHSVFCDKSTQQQRHGLGLMIVKQIIAVHSGKIKICSNSDRGLSVALSLPVCNE